MTDFREWGRFCSPSSVSSHEKAHPDHVEKNHIESLRTKEEENHVKTCEANMNYWREKNEYSPATDEIT